MGAWALLPSQASGYEGAPPRRVSHSDTKLVPSPGVDPPGRPLQHSCGQRGQTPPSPLCCPLGSPGGRPLRTRGADPTGPQPNTHKLSDLQRRPPLGSSSPGRLLIAPLLTEQAGLRPYCTPYPPPEATHPQALPTAMGTLPSLQGSDSEQPGFQARAPGGPQGADRRPPEPCCLARLAHPRPILVSHCPSRDHVL